MVEAGTVTIIEETFARRTSTMETVLKYGIGTGFLMLSDIQTPYTCNVVETWGWRGFGWRTVSIEIEGELEYPHMADSFREPVSHALELVDVKWYYKHARRLFWFIVIFEIGFAAAVGYAVVSGQLFR